MATVSRDQRINGNTSPSRGVAASAAGSDGMRFLTASAWTPGGRRRALESSGPVTARSIEAEDAVLCVEVDFGAPVGPVLDALRILCDPEISRDMVDDLLDTDRLPKVYQWPGTSIRSVSAFAARADFDGDAIRCGLEFDVVEFLAGPDWLVVSCHAQNSYADGGIELPRQDGCSSLLDSIETCWLRTGGRTAADLGVLILEELAKTHRPARRHLTRGIERWEVSYFNEDGLSYSEEDGTFRQRLEQLIQLRGAIGDFHDRLSEMNVEREDAAESWFNGVTIPEVAARTDQRIDSSLDELDRLRDQVRASLELMHSQTAARQLELSRKQQASSERLQTKIELITSAFLVPTLIAGIFGANTALPGGNSPHRWLGFEFMVATMVAGALIVFVVLRLLRKRNEDEAVLMPGGMQQ